MRFYIVIMILIGSVLVSQGVAYSCSHPESCTPGMWAKLGAPESNTPTFSTSIPALVVGPRRCPFPHENNPPHDVLPEGARLELLSLKDDKALNVSVQPEPGRGLVYHITPEGLEEGVKYELKVYNKGGALLWSMLFKAKSLALPPTDLALDVEVSTPQWVSLDDRSQLNADCSFGQRQQFQRTIRGKLPEALAPWRNFLIWNVLVDDVAIQNDAFAEYGVFSQTLGRSCKGDDLDQAPIEHTYSFEAYIPGTALKWTSAPVKVALGCTLEASGVVPDGEEMIAPEPAENEQGCAQSSGTPSVGHLLWLFALFGFKRRER